MHTIVGGMKAVPHLCGKQVLDCLKQFPEWSRFLPEGQPEGSTSFACKVLNTFSGGALMDALTKVDNAGYALTQQLRETLKSEN